MNRSEWLNAKVAVSLTRFVTLLDEVRDDQEARALILTGKGRAFCSGTDLAAKGPQTGGIPVDQGQSLEASHNLVVDRMHHLPVPIVCAVNAALRAVVAVTR